MSSYYISDSIKQELAQCIIKQSFPGYSPQYHGEYFAVDTDGDGELDTIMFQGNPQGMEPWHDSAVAISVEAIAAAAGIGSADEADSYDVDYVWSQLPDLVFEDELEQ